MTNEELEARIEELEELHKRSWLINQGEICMLWAVLCEGMKATDPQDAIMRETLDKAITQRRSQIKILAVMTAGTQDFQTHPTCLLYTSPSPRD